MSASVATPNSVELFHTRAYGIKSPEEALAVYEEWAKSYDTDVYSDHSQYAGPSLVADAVTKYLSGATGIENLQVLDAGCGTGLAGVALLAKLNQDSSLSLSPSQVTMDGLDITPGMLERASQTKIYRNLQKADLNKPLSASVEIADSTYDVVICVGTLTEGHVGPKVLAEFVRIVKPNGLIAATVLDKIWDNGGYKEEVEKLKQNGDVEVVQDKLELYRKAVKLMARVLVLRKSA